LISFEGISFSLLIAIVNLGPCVRSLSSWLLLCIHVVFHFDVILQTLNLLHNVCFCLQLEILNLVKWN
jgi:hypothetical protein